MFTLAYAYNLQVAICCIFGGDDSLILYKRDVLGDDTSLLAEVFSVSENVEHHYEARLQVLYL